ncbi:glycosyltransferase family 25 protein [Roseibacterium sp. SDUM158017]|uniref:glycosyltransferase family 25 protein n=1 Tax=Roseicyclus salinarum TaxID=3036773 RepID=UPI0024151805|nr:glycosyltransferase family 25 protein [Roseibacterium sp. SDUM158017]MDG4647138.1 glycosyltransferase family 25 protein [Roseibacterium sp. SDUM158017]
MKPSIFVINLDRRPDRLAFMARQLEAMNLPWQRVPAHDMRSVDETLLAREVALSGHRVGMGRGSQCCALTNFDIYRRIVADDLPAALILQDDVELSPDLAPFIASLDWLPRGVEIVQFEKYGRKRSSRLTGPALGTMPVAGRSLHRLHSRTAGAACYLITQAGAARILAEKPLLDMPIDHFLFSPNVSPLFERLGVAVVRPALARQRDEDMGSDLAGERKGRSKGVSARLRRLWQEVNRAPAQLAAMTRGARWRDFTHESPHD